MAYLQSFDAAAGALQILFLADLDILLNADVNSNQIIYDRSQGQALGKCIRIPRFFDAGRNAAMSVRSVVPSQAVLVR